VANYNDRVRVMVLNATFNNISAISWLPVLLVDETGLPIENNRPAASDCVFFVLAPVQVISSVFH
jgi:hypothetical protein